MSVKKQLRFIARRIDKYRRHLSNPLEPIPMGEDMRHRIIGPPRRLHEVEEVLLKTGQVDRAKIGTSRRHRPFAQLLHLRLHFRFLRGIREIQQVGGVIVIGRRFSEIVEASPEELPEHVRELRLGLEFIIGW